jgi:hypothetical protein
VAMSAEREDWTDWDTVLGDGLDEVPWEPAKVKRVADAQRGYPASAKRTSKRTSKRASKK